VRCAIFVLALALSPLGAAAERELGVAFARGTESADTDIVRVTYRHPLRDNGDRWMPAQLQLGVGVWRVPDIRGTTRRLDFSATPIWRAESSRGYLEGGVGLYLLSKTINNDENRLPSSFQFGSHIGTGLYLGKKATLGIALQHLSNAGIKQPNGGIDLLMVTAGLALD
jgi:Lipid A 3-O-deacylase (PagL)